MPCLKQNHELRKEGMVSDLDWKVRSFQLGAGENLHVAA